MKITRSFIFLYYLGLVFKVNANPLEQTNLRSNHPEFSRKDLRLQIEYDRNNIFFSFEDLYRTHGVIIDDASKIFSHDSEGLINLDCFNCLIDIRNASDAISSPENDIIKAK